MLLPHRSLSPAGFRLLMASLVVAFGAVGAVFTALGAWPVLPFCGAELVLIYWVFRVNDRDARLYETLMLTECALTVERVKPVGRSDSFRFAPPHWLRVAVRAATRQRSDA